MKPLLLCFLLLSSACMAQDVKTLVNINYFGKNVFIQNQKEGSGFCVSKVMANGVSASEAEVSVAVIEIKLRDMGMKEGAPVKIEIWHKPGCAPKVISGNTAPKKELEIFSVAIDAKGHLHWKTRNEAWKLYYIVEQYRWNKWIKLGELEAKGGEGEQEYSYPLVLNSGINKVRIKYFDLNAKPHYSKIVEFVSDVKEVTIAQPADLNKVKGQIVFSEPTFFEIYDEFGLVIKKGTAQSIDCTLFQKGTYYLNFDNQTKVFIKT
ncbi:MAG: hypothetical protein AB1458_09320 [Bacteroidota bacterium]